jgi:uncharacterized protein (TIGR03435 family)
MRRNRASVRHLLFAAVFVTLLVLPLGAVLVPVVELPIAAQRATGPVAFTADGDVGLRTAKPERSFTPLLSPASERRPVSRSTWLLVAWAVGALVFLLPICAGLWQLREVRRFSVPWLRGHDIVREFATEAGIRRSVEVLMHESFAGPMTYGVVRPVIVFPPDAGLWNQEDLGRAIIHELEHVRRMDWATHCIARAVCALYWFHPLVWMSWRQLSLEAERACDDAVLRRGEPTLYAEQLVTLAQRLSRRADRPLLAMANRGDLPARVAAVLDFRLQRERAGVPRVTAVLMLAFVFAAAISPVRTVAATQSVPAAAYQAFDAVSIKVNTSGERSAQSGGRPGGIQVRNDTLRNIIRNIWDLNALQLVGGPAWIDDARFDIIATAPGRPTRDQMIAMAKAMMTDRFKLVVHTETRPLPVYALVLARADGQLGPHLRPSSLTTCNPQTPLAPGTPRPAPPHLAGVDIPTCGTSTDSGILRAGGIQLDSFARSMSGAAAASSSTRPA